MLMRVHMALDPQWRKARRPGIHDAPSEPARWQWVLGIVSLVGVLALMYYLSVSVLSFNFFAQTPP